MPVAVRPPGAISRQGKWIHLAPEGGQLVANVFNSPNLEQFFS